MLRYFVEVSYIIRIKGFHFFFHLTRIVHRHNILPSSIYSIKNHFMSRQSISNRISFFYLCALQFSFGLVVSIRSVPLYIANCIVKAEGGVCVAELDTISPIFEYRIYKAYILPYLFVQYRHICSISYILHVYYTAYNGWIKLCAANVASIRKYVRTYTYILFGKASTKLLHATKF